MASSKSGSQKPIQSKTGAGPALAEHSKDAKASAPGKSAAAAKKPGK